MTSTSVARRGLARDALDRRVEDPGMTRKNGRPAGFETTADNGIPRFGFRNLSETMITAKIKAKTGISRKTDEDEDDR